MTLISEAETAAAPAMPPAGKLVGSFVIGLFSVTLMDLYALIVPLFAISFGAGPAEIGLLAGARSAGPALFALHGGSLVDRLGTRRVLYGGSLAAAVAALLIPALPWFWPLFFLQFASGLTTTFNWIAAQALVAHLCHGDARIFGRYNFVIRSGTIAGPVDAGALWDYAGAWPTFSAIFILALALHVLARFAPEPDAALAASARPPLLSALPRLADYTRSLKLMLIPVIAFTIVISTLRNGMNGIQTSVYISYLQEIGYPGTMIGILFGAAELTLALTSLGVGIVKR
jgi:MFS family permease